MKKWELIKVLLEIFLCIALVVVVIISLYGFMNAELIVDKIHYGFILTFALIFICDGNNKNNNGKLVAN